MGHLSRDNGALLARVRRIAGQVGAVERALAGEGSCGEILQLVAAVRGAVHGLLDEVIVEHLNEHVAAPGLDDSERAAAAKELMTVIRRYSK